MPASAPPPEGKLNPSATWEDQDVEMPRLVMTTPPFSSLDPATDGRRMQTIDESDASGATGQEEAAAVADSDKKAADWKSEIDAATTTDELDAVATRYAESGSDYKTVQEALDKKYTDLADES